MRNALLLCLAPAVLACDCGSYPASGPRDEEPPGTPGCAVEAPEPVAIHEVAAGARIDLLFSACGHLFASVDDADTLAGPDLARLVPLSRPDEWVNPRAWFAPTGDLLLRYTAAGARTLDLGTGLENTLGPARDQGFLPSHDLRRSILRRCTDLGLTAWDRDGERVVVPGADCERYASTAWFAPIAVAAGADERLLVADLERGTVLDTGLPWSQRDEPTPDGEPGYRDDAAFLTWDGRQLLHARRWQVFRGDTVEYVGTGMLNLIDTDDGASVEYPFDAADLLGFFRSGFVWRADWDRTYVGGATGVRILERRCNVALVSSAGDHVLLACYHESEPATWQDHLVDTRDGSVVDLGGTWSVRSLSTGGQAIAGCPYDAWRGGSCTVPIVRRWRAGEGVRDLPLDRTADVLWVGDDGAVLAIASPRDEAILLAPDGGVRARFPLFGDPNEQVRCHVGEDLLLLHARNGSLEAVVPSTGFHARLAESAVRAEFDGRRRVAFTVPDGERFRLFAGAIPR